MCGVVTSNSEEKPLLIKNLKFGNSSLSSRYWILSKHPPSMPMITFLIKKHQLYTLYKSYVTLKVD